MLSLRKLVAIPLCLTLATILASSLSAQENIRVWYSNPRGVLPGSIMNISIMMSSTRQLGGIDLTVHYDDSLLSFISAAQDTGLKHWEYFLTTQNDSLNTVRIVSIANGGSPLTSPDSIDYFPKGSIVNLQFFVDPTWLADSGRVAFDYLWPLCTSNAMSNIVGDTLIMLRRIYDRRGHLVWDETDNTNYPDENRPPMLGVADSCLVGATKVAMEIDFYYGEATNYYICGDADASDGISVADAVRIINYIFASGQPPNPLAAGDADCSGEVSISDAVYLIGYIFGGGPPPCASCP